MSRNSKPYRYVHPEHIISTYICTDSDGTQLIFRCPMCPMYGEKASFSLIERVGRCFVCKGIIKLHSMYDNIPVEVLFKDLVQRTPVPTQGSDKPASRAKIVTRPLSQVSLEYIASRGIPMDVVQQFSVLAETTYYGNLYLAWRTSAGGYELRATFQTTWAKITPHGHPKAFTLVRLMPDASTCIVCEGLFSALSYAQLFPRLDAWYVILNSTSNADQLAHALPLLSEAGITDVILALDHDQAGHETTDALADCCQELGLRVHRHLPPHDGEDWNDALLHHQRQH
jgi:Toprim-like